MKVSAAGFLASLVPSSTEVVHWPGNLSFEVQTFVTTTAPPSDFLTSARAVVLHGDRVLVLTDQSPSTHILPGGRIEPGEEPRTAAVREAGEESGWHITVGLQIGVLHFRHLQPRPDGYAHLYPEFFQVVFVAEALRFDEGLREADGWETESRFIRIEDALTLELHAGERLLLAAAQHARSHIPEPDSTED